MKIKFSIILSLLAVIILSSFGIKENKSTPYVGKWILIEENIQVFDGNQLITSNKDDSNSGKVYIEFGSNNIATYKIGDSFYKFKIAVNGKEIQLTSINGDSEDIYFVYELKNGNLHLTEEIMDDPGDESLQDPSLKKLSVYKKI